MGEDASSIFERALELEGAELEAYLSEACGDDASLRARVEALLRADREAGAFLEEPLAGEQGAALVARAFEESGEGLPDRIGRYRIEKLIGKGGMGDVFLAEQEEPVRRRVALKLIRRGLDSEQVVARFEAERQALAVMDHPGVARVFDGGTSEDGRPYFVMEYVEGLPITGYCDERSLSLEARLELFIQVCEAVQHAHSKGVIHRDLKPSNILVVEDGGRAQPKVIDFGVARATNRELAEQTLFTEVGQLVGTPEYMSPEQADLLSRDIDTRSDVYSLGVVLYELLTGVLPFEPETLRGAGLAEIQRIIREQDPPKPSTRLSALGQTPSTASESRKSDPKTLPHQLRGDLDWIAMRCIAKERARRYQTVAGLAEEIRRYLKQEPVLAGPPGMMYRMRKFSLRHRTGVLSGGLLAALLFAFVIVSIVLTAKLRTESARSLAVNKFFDGALSADAMFEGNLGIRYSSVLDNAWPARSWPRHFRETNGPGRWRRSLSAGRTRPSASTTKPSRFSRRRWTRLRRPAVLALSSHCQRERSSFLRKP